MTMRNIYISISISILLITIINGCKVNGQPEEISYRALDSFKRIDPPPGIGKNGPFSNAEFTTAYQDNNDNIWLGSEVGLYVFDGNEFIHFQIDEKYPTLLITSIDEDIHGNIWIGTERGIYWMNGNSFYPLQIPKPEGTKHFISDLIKDTLVTKLMFDKKGDLWYGIENGGLWRYNGKEYYQYKPRFGNWDLVGQRDSIEGSIEGHVQELFEDKEGRIWVSFHGTHPSISYYENETFHPVNTASLSDQSIYSIKQDKKGKIWMDSKVDGLLYLQNEKLVHLKSSKSPDTSSAFGLVIDPLNNIWATHFIASPVSEKTYIGVRKFDGVKYHDVIDRRITNEQMVPLLADRDGNIWLRGIGFKLFVHNGSETINCISGV